MCLRAHISVLCACIGFQRRCLGVCASLCLFAMLSSSRYVISARGSTRLHCMSSTSSKRCDIYLHTHIRIYPHMFTCISSSKGSYTNAYLHSYACFSAAGVAALKQA